MAEINPVQSSNALNHTRRASEQEIKNIKDFLKAEKARFSEMFENKFTSSGSIDDFNRLSTLGAGSFGRVLLVQHKNSKKFYALKILEKKKVVVMEQLEHTLNEKKILLALNHPFMVYMVYYFIDNSYVYFVMPFVNGGEMFTLLKKFKIFDEELSRFYAAQVCLGLEYLHCLELIYRDLKPENLLIDWNGYLKITDFGFSKLIKGRTYTLCGTPEYLAPEIVLGRGYSQAVDWWAFGVLIFEMNSGFAPFKHKDPMALYDKITAGKYKNPQHFSLSLRELLRRLLETDLSKRYGNLTKGADDIKEHRWFKTINWLALLNKKITAPYKPEVENAEDSSNFVKFSNEPLKIASKNEFDLEFADF